MKAIGWQVFFLLALWLVASPILGAYVHDSGVLEYGWIWAHGGETWVNIPFICSWLLLDFATLIVLFELYDWLKAKK